MNLHFENFIDIFAPLQIDETRINNNVYDFARKRFDLYEKLFPEKSILIKRSFFVLCKKHAKKVNVGVTMPQNRDYNFIKSIATAGVKFALTLKRNPFEICDINRNVKIMFGNIIINYKKINH